MAETILPLNPNEEAFVTVHRGDIILVDMDNVGADFIGKVLRVWKEDYPHIPAPDRQQIEHYEIGHGLDEDAKKLIRQIWHRQNFYLDLDLEPDVTVAIREMSEAGLDVVFCSAPVISPPETTCHSNKVNWIYEHFGLKMASDCALLADKTMIRGDVLIDDKPTIHGRCRPFWEHVYYDAPWNRHENMDKHQVPNEGRGVARLHAWKDWRKTIRIYSR